MIDANDIEKIKCVCKMVEIKPTAHHQIDIRVIQMSTATQKMTKHAYLQDKIRNIGFSTHQYSHISCVFEFYCCAYVCVDKHSSQQCTNTKSQ